MTDTPVDRFNAVAVATRAALLVAQENALGIDPALSIAALRAAADALSQAVAAATLAAVIAQQLAPKR